MTDRSPSSVRYAVIAVSVLMAAVMYLDRICLGVIIKSDSFGMDPSFFGKSALTDEQKGQILGAFFFTYALFQIPAGWASDRWGARQMLTGYILLWSLFTGLTGMMTSVTGLLVMRLMCGVAQAGAYPTSGGAIRRWFSLEQRGRASAVVSLGGRLGATFTPVITVFSILMFGGWRGALWAYCVLGCVVAALYWYVLRDRPDAHPWANDAERQLIGRPVDDARPTFDEVLPVLAEFSLSRSLWMNSIGQFCVNVGWAFLINWLPTYLKNKSVDETTGSTMVTLVLAAGILGQMVGGFSTDFAIKRFGLRWGRTLPIACSAFIAGLAYVSCPFLDSVSPWAIVGCCMVVSLMTDIGNPATWGFMQDIGGKNTATAYGWGNMWGNFGASFSAVMVPAIQKLFNDPGDGQRMVFIVCGSAFFVTCAASFGMDATRRITVRKDRGVARPSQSA